MATLIQVCLVWATICGWQLTLVSVAVVSVFVVVMRFRCWLISKCEARNKVARVEVTLKYYEVSSFYILLFLFHRDW